MMDAEHIKQLKYARTEIAVTADMMSELIPHLRADRPNDVINTYVKTLNSAKKRIDEIIEEVENDTDTN